MTNPTPIMMADPNNLLVQGLNRTSNVERPVAAEEEEEVLMMMVAAKNKSQDQNGHGAITVNGDRDLPPLHGNSLPINRSGPATPEEPLRRDAPPSSSSSRSNASAGTGYSTAGNNVDSNAVSNASTASVQHNKIIQQNRKDKEFYN